MNRLRTLERALAASFGLRPARTPVTPKLPDSGYRAIRAYCAKHQVTYKLARDGYIEFSTGQVFAHHGDWSETLARLQAGDGLPAAGDSTGQQGEQLRSRDQ